ncbi:hypothetical protein WJX73_005183 [Symbiochloris irregularis]|uniref:CENP-V/GFA domain-containing protein n=1 Tax=Symbiochloris irregularis TaxID=706552 RepID=A0AAW1PAM3_9CHLO
MATVSGGCLCRQVRYEATLPSAPTASYCHCRMCQQSMASPVGMFTGVPEGSFKWTAGTAKAYQSSTHCQRFFCPNCGSQLTFKDAGSREVDLAMVTLDDPAQITPDRHIYYESRIPWFETRDDLPRFDNAS